MAQDVTTVTSLTLVSYLYSTVRIYTELAYMSLNSMHFWGHSYSKVIEYVMAKLHIYYVAVLSNSNIQISFPPLIELILYDGF